MLEQGNSAVFTQGVCVCVAIALYSLFSIAVGVPSCVYMCLHSVKEHTNIRTHISFRVRCIGQHSVSLTSNTINRIDSRQ